MPAILSWIPQSRLMAAVCIGAGMFLFGVSNGVAQHISATGAKSCGGTCAPAGKCGADEDLENNCNPCSSKSGSSSCKCDGGYICYNKNGAKVSDGACEGECTWGRTALDEVKIRTSAPSLPMTSADQDPLLMSLWEGQ